MDKRSDDDELDRLIHRATNPPALDDVLAVLAGSTSMIPLAGGVLAAAVNEWRQATGAERLEAVLLAFQRRLLALGERLDRDYLSASPEYRDVFEQLLDSAALARNAAKQDYYAAAMANSAAIDRPPDAERRLMVETLNRIDPLHLLLLAAIARYPRPYDAAREFLHPGTTQHNYIHGAIHEITLELLERAWDDLTGLSILASPRIPMFPNERRPLITAFGKRFLRFIEAS
jgi:hypothetical protein